MSSLYPAGLGHKLIPAMPALPLQSQLPRPILSQTQEILERRNVERHSETLRTIRLTLIHSSVIALECYRSSSRDCRSPSSCSTTQVVTSLVRQESLKTSKRQRRVKVGQAELFMCPLL